MNYGFLIRNDRCIGCHACSTACKAENQVPLGVHRTWVKTVEAGAFPDVRRHFQVTRCNHCADPPCVAICPTRAMYQRDDGIVEFDPDRCIGCKACLQGCPYDAIHIDPDSGTAAKCHFCAHRVELAMEPPCVVVCPEHAIIAGDMDDPTSEISRELARHQVTVRRPEKGTKPKLFYVDGDEAALHPGLDGTATAYAATERGPGGMQGDRRQEGPIRVGRGRMADELVRTAYDVEHKVPWHWPVPAYLVTKGIAAGIFLLLAGGVLAGAVPLHERTFLGLGFLILLFLGATTVLLVADLERPERFHWVLLKAHPRSWLVKGAWILMAFSTLVGLWWIVELAVWQGWWGGPGGGSGQGGLAAPLDAVRPGLLVLGTPLAILVAIYTAFLFGQAKGRDLWGSPLLSVHLLAQALLAGSAALLVLQPLALVPAELVVLAWWTFAVVLLVDLLLLIPAEFASPHGSDTARAAARAIVRGRYRKHFWGGAVLLGHVIPLLLLGAMALSAPILLDPAEAYGAFEAAPWLAVAGGIMASALAGVASLVGLYLYEHAWVMAPQELRNS